MISGKVAEVVFLIRDILKMSCHLQPRIVNSIHGLASTKWGLNQEPSDCNFNTSGTISIVCTLKFSDLQTTRPPSLCMLLNNTLYGWSLNQLVGHYT